MALKWPVALTPGGGAGAATSADADKATGEFRRSDEQMFDFIFSSDIERRSGETMIASVVG
jgi:hypothetical protein